MYRNKNVRLEALREYHSWIKYKRGLSDSAVYLKRPRPGWQGGRYPILTFRELGKRFTNTGFKRRLPLQRKYQLARNLWCAWFHVRWKVSALDECIFCTWRHLGFSSKRVPWLMFSRVCQQLPPVLLLLTTLIKFRTLRFRLLRAQACAERRGGGQSPSPPHQNEI